MKRWLFRLGIVAALYTVAGFLIAPAVLKWQLRKQLTKFTHRVATVGTVRLNPYTLTLVIRDLSLTEPTGERFAALGELRVNLELRSALKRGLVLKELALIEPYAHVVIRADGSSNFANLIPTNAPAHPPVAAPAGLPYVLIEELRIAGARLDFADHTRATPLREELGPVHFTLRNFTTHPAPGSPYTFEAHNAAGASLAWAGDLGLHPPRSAGHIKITGLQLAKTTPYLQEFARLHVADGRLSIEADYQFAYDRELVFEVSRGGLELTDLRVEADQPLLTVPQLAVRDVAVSLTNHTVRIGVITTRDGRLRAQRNAAGQLDWLALLNSPPAAPNTNPAPAATAWQVALAEFTVAGWGVEWSDDAVSPGARLSLDQLSGTLTNLSSAPQSAAGVALTGRANGRAPFTVTGRVNPLAEQLFIELAAQLQEKDLTAFAPYAARYVGHPVERGWLSLDLQYRVTRDELTAENKVRVHNLAFGDRVESPDAVNLPVQLAVALLQDRHGIINLDVPVRGRLDDPQFRLGKVITQVLLNIVTKAVTKPFALLGSLLGSDDDLSFVACVAGQPELREGERRKLDLLARALAERPALILEIAGAVDPAADRPALQALRLEEQLAAGADREQQLKLAYATAIGQTSEQAIKQLTARRNFRSARPAPTGATPPATELTVAGMEQFLRDRIVVGEADYAALAQQRAATVQAHLWQTGQVESNRIVVGAASAGSASLAGARFSLR